MKRPATGLLVALALAACAPTLQRAARPTTGFTGPRLEPQANVFVSFDGARLGLTEWDATGGGPWAVIIGLHGMNDYANAFHLAAPWWAEHGITTLAYDQRGFGRSPERGVWSPEALSVEDLRTIVALARTKYPHAIIAVAGESLGGAVAIEAFASASPPTADRLVLLSPAVWGWANQPISYRIALWVADHIDPAGVVRPPGWVTKKIWASDNLAELYAMGRDPRMIWGARSDALFGLVETMDRAWRQTGDLKTPTLYLYGAHDEIIPKRASFQAAARLPPGARTGYYANGWHLLLRDLQAERVWADVADFIREPAAPLPSGAPPIPSPGSLATGAGVVAGSPPA